MSGIMDAMSGMFTNAGNTLANSGQPNYGQTPQTGANNTIQNFGKNVGQFLKQAGGSSTANEMIRDNPYADADLGGSDKSYADGDLGGKEVAQDYRGMKIAPQTPIQSKELSVDPSLKLQAAQNAAFAKMDEAQQHYANVKNAEMVAYRQAQEDAKLSLLKTHGTSHEDPNAQWQMHGGAGGNFVVDPRGGTYYVPDKGHKALEVLTGPSGVPSHRLPNVPADYGSGGGVENYDVAPKQPGQEMVAPPTEQPGMAPPQQQIMADADLQEPQGQAHWTLREEKDFILAKNQRTGEVRKLVTAPLSKQEQKQAEAPHGAGSLSANDPQRVHSRMNDMQMRGPSSPQEIYQSLMQDKYADFDTKLAKNLDSKFRGKK